MTAPVILRQWKSDALERASIAADAIADVHPEVADKAKALKEADGRDALHAETNRLVALADLMEAVAAAVGVPLDEGANEPEERTLEDVDGIGPDIADNLREAGIESPEDLRDASDEDLIAIDGIGEGKLKRIKADL